MDNDPLDPILRKPSILAVLDVHNSTLNAWIKRGEFPPPLVLNPGQKREIVGWLTSVFLQWRVTRPQRPARPISANSYTTEARSKGERTRATRRAAKGEAGATVPAVEPRDALLVRRPRS